jgi:hypothetical protein
VLAGRFDTRWLERWLEENAERLSEANGKATKEVVAR